jgi:hypothetical protein
MKQLTKEEKLEAYTYAMFVIFDEPWCPFVCYSLVYWVKYFKGAPFCMAEMFNEFERQRKGRVGAWWPVTPSGNRSRLRAIERAMNLVEKI